MTRRRSKPTRHVPWLTPDNVGHVHAHASSSPAPLALGGARSLDPSIFTVGSSQPYTSPSDKKKEILPFRMTYGSGPSFLLLLSSASLGWADDKAHLIGSDEPDLDGRQLIGLEKSGSRRPAAAAMEAAADAPDLVCQLDCVQGMVDALTSVRWKKHQDALVEISEHGIVLTVEEAGCLQAKVYLKSELFIAYEFSAEGRPRFGLSLGLFVDCLNIFSSPGHAPVIEMRYPGPDMQLLLTSVDSANACTYAEIRTRVPDTISWDYNFESTRNVPLSFTVKSSLLKEAIDDLEWPGSSIQIVLQPEPPSVILRGEGHGDLQIEFPYYANTDLLIAFHCDRPACHRYKYKFLRAATANIPSSVLKENRGSKLSIGRCGMLKIQHLVFVGRAGNQHPYGDASNGIQPSSRIAYIEFYVKPDEVEDS